MASVLCLACDRDQAKIVKGYARSYFTAIDELRAMVTREIRDGLELSNSAEIIVSTNSYRQARGRTILLAILETTAAGPRRAHAAAGFPAGRFVMVPGRRDIAG